MTPTDAKLIAGNPPRPGLWPAMLVNQTDGTETLVWVHTLPRPGESVKLGTGELAEVVALEHHFIAGHHVAHVRYGKSKAKTRVPKSYNEVIAGKRKPG